MGETDTWRRDSQQGNSKSQSFPAKADMEAVLALLEGPGRSPWGDMSAPSPALLGPRPETTTVMTDKQTLRKPEKARESHKDPEGEGMES